MLKNNKGNYNIFHNRRTFFILFSFLVLFVSFFNTDFVISQNLNKMNQGDIAWMIVASAFVLLMTPGLAFFYGGMVDKKNVISTMFQSFIALGIISIFWVFIGFSLSFGDSIDSLGIIGDPFQYLNFKGVLSKSSNIPFLLFAIFQLKFAVITPALVSGSFAERIRFRSYIMIKCDSQQCTVVCFTAMHSGGTLCLLWQVTIKIQTGLRCATF